MRRLPLTPLGWALAVGAVVMLSMGWWLGWIEFIVVGVGCLIALLSAIPWVLGSYALTIERVLVPERVSVGEPGRSELTITNVGARTFGTLVNDSIAGSPRTIDVPLLAQGEEMRHVDLLPTAKRGRFEIGPGNLAKGDPLGLLRRDLSECEMQYLWVFPRYKVLKPLHSGFAKDLEGPTFDTSPAGDVAFHTIREYQPGDDIRQIHWMSTARVGQLMLKQNVDNRRPFLGVVVDANPQSMSPDQFEVALEIATSLAISAVAESRPIALWVGDQSIVSQDHPGTRDSILERLCIAEQHNSELHNTARRCRLSDQGLSAIVLVTGNVAPRELLPTVMESRSDCESLVMRVADGAEPQQLVPGAPTIDTPSLERFAAQWAGLLT